MASIMASPGTFGKKIESNTHNLEEWVVQLVNELRRLRIGDNLPVDGSVL
jgi:hypothetical protein